MGRVGACIVSEDTRDRDGEHSSSQYPYEREKEPLECTKPGTRVQPALSPSQRMSHGGGRGHPFSHKLPLHLSSGDLSDIPAVQMTLWPLDLVESGSRFLVSA